MLNIGHLMQYIKYIMTFTETQAILVNFNICITYFKIFYYKLMKTYTLDIL